MGQVAEDRRAHGRFAVKEGGLAFLETIPTTIVDISECGMAVHFVVLGEEPKTCFPLDIFHGAENFYLAGLPAELVSVVDLPPASRFSIILVKRASIRFGKLDDEQKNRLKYFINTMTTGSC